MPVSKTNHAELKKALSEDCQSIRDILAELWEVDDEVYEALQTFRDLAINAIEIDKEAQDASGE